MKIQFLMFCLAAFSCFSSCQQDSVPRQQTLSEEEALEYYWEMGAKAYEANGLDPKTLYIKIADFRKMYEQDQMPNQEDINQAVAEMAPELLRSKQLAESITAANLADMESVPPSVRDSLNKIAEFGSQEAYEDWLQKSLSPDYYQKGKALHVEGSSR